MNAEEKRKKLIRFLDRKAFDPVLRKSENDFLNVHEREKFRRIKECTEREKQRFHNEFHTPVEVKQNYLSDLNSQAAKRVNRKLGDLNLPQLPEFKNEFLELCNKLRV
ncbi:hypothetical protein C900_03637 [Fulvivirga imtechensis AK7]|uniref:Uncharacterized protein n=1 Tax=Fulvivirga imtechensis AK7 TaxID=1237149 RepID=L8JNW7_9BACT|nr:hypothetical protein [Fulvivirga imtechensis]ELR70656.1 hypothetical protein C900_03637 [Fulvivirga imtechensis AK7]